MGRQIIIKKFMRALIMTGQRSMAIGPRRGLGRVLLVLQAMIFCMPTVGAVFAEAPRGTADAPRQAWPMRIVSINLCSDELLLRIVPADRIAAVSVHCSDPAISGSSEAAARIPKIKGSVEEVLAAEPDLLIGGSFSNRETLHFFKYSDIPVLVLGVPKSFDDIYSDIRKIAQTTGEIEKGEAMIKKMQDELAALKPKIAPGVDEKQRPAFEGSKRAVFFQSGGYVPGAGTFENAIMEAAGLVNVASELGIKDYGNLPLERLIDAKPDVLIFASDQKNGKTVRGEILDHPAIKKELPKVRTVTLPSALLNCGSPASVEAVRILVGQVAMTKKQESRI